MNIGEAIIAQLKALGVDTVFGIPGVHTAEMYRALPSSGIRHITPRHEQGAAFMADGYARVSGKPGVCLLITGPGLTNAATPIAQAYADSTPMLVLTSVNPEATWGKGLGRLHDLPDQAAFARSVCAMSLTIRSHEDIAPTFETAWSVFQDKRPRPVHIQVPLDVIPRGCPPITYAQPRRAQRSAGDSTAIAQAAQLLRQAKRPAMVIGGGCVDAHEPVRQLAEQLTMPVFNTFAAKGVVPADHPLLGGSFLGTDAVREYIAQADVVVACGTEFSATDLYPFFDVPVTECLIRIDIDDACSATPKPADVMIVGDSARVLTALSSAIGDDRSDRSEWLAQLAAVRLTHVVDPPFRQWLDALGSSIHSDVIVSADSTQLVYAGNNAVLMPTPRSWITSVTGYGTLGFALPAAIGAALAMPRRQVICLVGDGGLQFTLPELMAAVEQRLPIAIVVWHNDGYGEIRDFMVAQDVIPNGVNVRTPRIDSLAQAYGCGYVNVSQPDDLGVALQAAAQAEGPTLIEIPVA